MARAGVVGRWAVGLGLALTGCEAASAAQPNSAATPIVVAMPGPSQHAPAVSRAQLNASCVDCHEDAARTWSGSLHRRAWTEDDFAQAREPRPFCRSCHAPEGDPSRSPTAAAADMGVACVTCHVPQGGSLSPGAVLAAPGSSSTSPHPIVRSAAFATADACASCHEFASPRQPDLAMQSTISEHQRSEHASATCQDCHMPKMVSGRSHAFVASRDPAMLRSGLSVAAARPDEHTLRLTILPTNVGHTFPTGDPFRRLLLEVDAQDESGWFALERRPLQRSIERTRGRFPKRVEVEDTRVGGADDRRDHDFDLTDYETSLLRWRVVYQRLDHPFGPDEPVFFDQVPLFEGYLEPGEIP